ncbi:hypothetical protein GJ699_31690 [Duganella sp. FT80W]|uniref:PEP-CTERM sorting domain-containing protein n=1 Tax=Duganella guangzhouensis TaxID=2666084 RepID=A0A6I2L8I8_9BURK|nr:hypothetical protein [Duganella guangzhouensis]MRW94541.1 hypothetical protein [Duganella guangzhouensis]
MSTLYQQCMRRCRFAVCLFFFLCATAHAALIQYVIVDAHNALFTVSYTLTAEPGDLPIKEFSIAFDVGRYENLQLVATPSGWDSLVLQPDAALGADGIYDSLALGQVVDPATSLSGFTMRFTYLGADVPSGQRFDIIDPLNFAVVTSGTTSAIAALPEPEGWQLLVAGFAGLLLASRMMRRRCYAVWATALLLMPALASAQSLGVVEAAPPGAQIAQLIKVAETRVSRTVYRYRYQVEIQNGELSLKNLRVQLTAAGAGTVILSGLAKVGDLVAGAKAASKDDIIFEHNRLQPFALDALRWRIIADPPGALGQLDYSAPLTGTDVDGNGIRDDVDGVIAELLPEPSVAAAAAAIAAALQRQLGNEEASVAAAAQAELEQGLACLAHRSTDYARIARTLFVVTFNTRARLEANIQHMDRLDPLRETDLTVTSACVEGGNHARTH